MSHGEESVLALYVFVESHFVEIICFTVATRLLYFTTSMLHEECLETILRCLASPVLKHCALTVGSFKRVRVREMLDLDNCY